jgi:hypothetical protein
MRTLQAHLTIRILGFLLALIQQPPASYEAKGQRSMAAYGTKRTKTSRRSCERR